jgi:hypothetical protein
MKKTDFLFVKFLTFCIFLVLNFSLPSFADIENYYVGLKAYGDGFYDISIINLEEFLSQDNSSKESIYAKYLLYKSYYKQKDYKNAKLYLNMIKDINDDRFDRRSIILDKIFLTALDNCTSAYKIIEENKDYTLNEALIGTKCAIDNKSDIDISQLDDKMRFFYIMQVDSRDKIKNAFDMINLKNLSKDEIKQLSIKLYKYELMNDFWKTYEIYRDKDTINLAIERVWKVGKYDDVVKAYNFNKKFELLPETYCMVLDSHFKTNRKFNYSIIEKCFTVRDEKYYKALIRAYSDNNDIEKLKKIINSIPDNYTSILCEFGSSLITSNLLDIKNYSRLSNCENLDNISDDLIKKGLAKELILLRKNVNNEKSDFYLAYAYGLMNKKKLLTKYYNAIKDKELKKILLKRFKKELK